MLVWLDGDQNKVGKPNENYARESMELFTIGVGPALAIQNAVRGCLAGSPTAQDTRTRTRGVLQLALGSPESQLN